MAEGKEIRLKCFILALMTRDCTCHGDKVLKVKKRTVANLAWRLNGDKGEGEINGGHGRGVLSALCRQHQQARYIECKGMFVVNAASDKTRSG